MPYGIGAGLGALFKTLGAEKLNDARMGLLGQKLAEQQALRAATVRKSDAATALANNQLSGLNAIAGDIHANGVPLDRAELIAAAIQANKGANLNTTSQGLGRLFLQNGLGDRSGNLQSIGSPLTRVGGGVAYNPNIAPTDVGQAFRNVGATPARIDVLTAQAAAAAANPVKYSAMSENLNGVPTYLGSDGQIYQPHAGALAPVGASAQPQHAGSSDQGTHVAFDFAPGTPPQVIAAAHASAAANGDLAPTTAPSTTPTRAPAPGWGKPGSYQGAASATLFGDPTKTGAAYIASIPEGNRGIVQGLLDGTKELPHGTTLKSPLWQSALASVEHADPGWNEAAYKQYASARKYFTEGKGGQKINQINTALQHMQKLLGDVQAMHNSAFTPYNAMVNQGENLFSHGALSNFNADITPVASELAAVYKGGAAPTDQEIAHFREALSPNLGHAKQVQVLRGWIDLLAGKLRATARQYQDSMSPLSQPLVIVKPEARDAFDTIENLNAKLNGEPPAQPPPQPPTYAPGGVVQQPSVSAAVPSGSANGSPIDALAAKWSTR